MSEILTRADAGDLIAILKLIVLLWGGFVLLTILAGYLWHSIRPDQSKPHRRSPSAFGDQDKFAVLHADRSIG